MLPEVVFFAQTNDAFCRDAVGFGPNVECFIIFFVDGDPQTVCRNFQNFGQEFPSPFGSFYFEVITEREVTQHFEEGTVTSGDTYALNVRSTDALLAGGHAFVRWFFQTEEVFFHWSHTGVDQQQALIIFWYEGVAWQAGVHFAFEERQIQFAQLIEAGPFHLKHLLIRGNFF